GRGGHAVLHGPRWDPGVHHAHDHRSDRGYGDDPAIVRGAMGGRQPGRMGLGAHDPGLVRDGVLRVPPVQGAAMRLSRRPIFFLAVAVACLALLAPTPSQFRWVNIAMAGLAAFWFVLLAIEELSGGRGTTRPTGGKR